MLQIEQLLLVESVLVILKMLPRVCCLVLLNQHDIRCPDAVSLSLRSISFTPCLFSGRCICVMGCYADPNLTADDTIIYLSGFMNLNIRVIECK